MDNNNIFNCSFHHEKNENSSDSNNIAGTPAFITTLMQYIKFSDEQRHGSGDKVSMAQQQPTPTVMSPIDASANAQPSIWTENIYEGENCVPPGEKVF